VPSASLGWLAEPDRGITIHFTCHNSVPQERDGFAGELHQFEGVYGWSIDAVSAAARWGPATTLEQLERKAVCKLCGARSPKVRVSLHVPTPPELIAGAGGTRRS
jgi:hypothetical protein